MLGSRQSVAVARKQREPVASHERQIARSEPFLRMSGAKLVSEPCQSAKTRFGVLHGPLGSFEKLIHVGSASLDAAPPGQSPGPVEPSHV